jgi:hypothetical protein
VAHLPRILLVGVLAAAQLLGCATDGRKPTSVLAGTPARNLLILPLNLAAVMPSQLDSLGPIVWEELEIYLRAQGKELKTLNKRQAKLFWLSSVNTVRAGEKGARAGYDDAARELVLELAKHAEFDTVIAPSLHIREARIYGRNASWDGVKRSLEVEAYGAAARGLSMNTTLEGVAPAASLHAVVLDARGNKLQEALGGIELLVSVHVMRRQSGEPVFEFLTRTDPFSDRAHVREAIAHALAPFIEPADGSD